MIPSLSLQSRPCLRAALLWSIPALLLGLALRLVLLHHNPYAYWSEDSNSYIKFAWKLFHEHTWELDRKRRWVYPIYLALTYLLPGSLLRWVSILQHLAMLGGVIFFAYTIRKVCLGWKWLILPGSVLFALHPHFIYYSDQALAETPFILGFVAAMAGWVSWTMNPDPKQRLSFARFLFFLLPFACVILSKPSGRMFWPGLLAALVISGHWRLIRLPQGIALLVLLIITPTVGKESQGVRLLYTSAFPLTRLETDLHAEYKAEIAPMVHKARADLRSYVSADKIYKNFLEHPARVRPDLKLWVALDEGARADLKKKVYQELAVEGMIRRPDLVLYMMLQKAIASHVKGVKQDRLAGTYYADRMAQKYLYPELSKERPALLRKLYGVTEEPLPDLAWFQRRVAPNPGGALSRGLIKFSDAYTSVLSLVTRTIDAEGQFQDRMTWAGLLTAAGLLLSAFPAYFRNVGAISLLSLSYLGGVFAVGSTNARFLVPVEPWMLLLLLLPLDAIFRLWHSRGKPERPAPASAAAA